MRFQLLISDLECIKSSFYSFTGRSLEARQVERFGILKVIEDSLQRYAEVEQSHECLVRTICEVAHTPVSGDGILVTNDEISQL